MDSSIARTDPFADRGVDFEVVSFQRLTAVTSLCAAYRFGAVGASEAQEHAAAAFNCSYLTDNA
jgi:hypothetical protein